MESITHRSALTLAALVCVTIARMPSLASTPAPSSKPSTSRATPASAKGIDALVMAGKFDEAVRAGRAAVAAGPEDPDLRKALAGALAARAKTVQRTAEIPVSSDDVAAGSVRVKLPQPDDLAVEVRYEASLFEEAIVQLDEALRRSPKRSDLHQSKIWLLTDAARIDRAEAALRAAVAVLPRTPQTARELAAFGSERTKRGDAEGGARLLGAVADSFQGDPAVQADLGFSLAKLGRRADALGAFDRAAAAAPRDLRILRLRATASMLCLDFGRARAAYDAAFLAGRQDPDRLGAAFARYGIEPNRAIADLEEMTAPASSSDPVAAELAARLVAAAQAGAASTEAIALSRTLVEQGQPVLALPVLEQALRAKPGGAEAVKLRKRVYDEMGFPKLAPGAK